MSAFRDVKALRRRSIRRPMTPDARGEREQYLEAFTRKATFTHADLQKRDRYRQELADNTFQWTTATRIVADDARRGIVYIDRSGCELWRRPQTQAERNLDLFAHLGKVG